ncbi:MAG: DNA internalization-related competence protein ComEC/Rec2 [Myxococcota bacterium]
MLVALTSCVALGIVAADLGGLSTAAWSASAALGIGLGLGPRRRALAALLLAFLAGHDAQQGVLARAEGARAAPAGGAVFEGVVTGRSGLVEPHWLEFASLRGLPGARLRVYGAISALEAQARRGERWRLRVTLRPERVARNPGGPSPRRLARRGIGQRASLRHPGLAVRRGAAPRSSGSIARARVALAKRMEAAGDDSGLWRGLVLGDRGAIAPGAREAFRRLGLSHLLAVSGWHLAWWCVVSFAVFAALFARSARAGRRGDTRRAALGPAALCGLGYAALAGGAVPVQRAAGLLVAGVVAQWLRRPVRPAPAFACIGGAVLVSAPAELFALGAQLSFGVVAALLWAPRPQGEHLRLVWVRTPLVAWMASLPILAAHGLAASPAGVLANLVLLPLFALGVLPLAFLGAAALLVGVAPEAEWVRAATAASEHGLAALRDGAEWIPLPRAPALGAVGWGLLAALWAAAWWSPGLGRRALFVCLTWLWITISVSPAASPELVAFDVGQGDATLVRGRRAVVLVDGGPAYPDGRDAGALRVVPGLAALGVERLDLVIATHADLDHRGGLGSVLDSVPTRELWLPHGAPADPGFDALVRRARERGVTVREVGRGSPRRRFGDLLVDPLWPPRGGSGSRNARSLVVRIDLEGGARVLLPGDIDVETEAALIATAAPLDAELLLLPHHGSGGSSSNALLRAVAPRWAWVSAPCRGRFALPHVAVRARLAGREIPWGWTGRDGALRVPLRGPLLPKSSGEAYACGSGEPASATPRSSR